MPPRAIAAVSLLALIAACSKQPSAPSPAQSGAQAAPVAGASRAVKAADGTEGEIIGTPGPRSKFARVQIGMTQKQVEALIGPASDTDTHITGKQFIPFYFGGDTNRLEAFYKGEGILTFAPSHFAGQANTLIRIIADTSETGVPH